VCGGRMRESGEAGRKRDILNELWWCSTASKSGVVWQAMQVPTSTAWQPRFHFAATATPSGGLVVFGGNVSTGLLKLPVDGWVYDGKAAIEEGEEEGREQWAPLAGKGELDGEGQEHPYGRVHATMVLVQQPGPAETSPARLLYFGGESTRPYMYHASVWEVPLAQSR
jgi:hypothetical protein